VFWDKYSRRVLRSLLVSRRLLRSLLSSWFDVITLIVFWDHYSLRVSRSLLSSWIEAITPIMFWDHCSHRVLRVSQTWFCGVSRLIVFWESLGLVSQVGLRVLRSYPRVLRVRFLLTFWESILRLSLCTTSLPDLFWPQLQRRHPDTISWMKLEPLLSA